MEQWLSAIQFLVILGVAIVLVGVFMFIRMWRFVATANSIAGTVVAIEAVRCNVTKTAERIFYHPVFDYTDPKGIRRRVRSSTGSDPASYRVGDAVTVLDGPNDVRIDSFNDLWSSSTIYNGPWSDLPVHCDRLVVFEGLRHGEFLNAANVA
ncbi:MAG: DUF3592 domain-containing protein [Proteobacteria bacterium]|nr:DUF3592 domain-containing protein [Pseudomonadota bacterium]